jgi:hypothetical protein
MASRSNLLELECDAPPYDIVSSSEAIGLRRPLDVRWCRIGHMIRKPESRGLWAFARRMFGIPARPRIRACSCGHEAPALDRVKFMCLGCSAGEFLLGQCPRCRTVYWEPLPPQNGEW